MLELDRLPFWDRNPLRNNNAVLAMLEWGLAVSVFVAYFPMGASQGPLHPPSSSRPKMTIFGHQNDKIADTVGV